MELINNYSQLGIHLDFFRNTDNEQDSASFFKMTSMLEFFLDFSWTLQDNNGLRRFDLRYLEIRMNSD
ncbi:hypothetical protein C1645_815443 [Glomus cerebriforme]|uniref:Uncharacterized protein n=1 Tax=Glomus cerebriforme TaxID=658196 RepID=A0A397TNG1_9GLOM|nr:hypothetical protein C1645_815443 [Glomus cerebriforme]